MSLIKAQSLLDDGLVNVQLAVSISGLIVACWIYTFEFEQVMLYLQILPGHPFQTTLLPAPWRNFRGTFAKISQRIKYGYDGDS